MSYDKKHVTTSFREALGKCIATGQGKSLEELHKMPRGAKLEEPVGEIQQLDEDQVAEDELDAVELDEAEFIAELEEEMTPHILELIQEGFSDEEIEELILEMLMADDEEIEDDEQLDEISAGKARKAANKAFKQSMDADEESTKKFHANKNRSSDYGRKKYKEAQKRSRQWDKFDRYASNKGK